jgi:hypothetical protein
MSKGGEVSSVFQNRFQGKLTRITKDGHYGVA